MTASDQDQLVLATNAAFYAAFNRRDMKAMAALWASRSPVACAHPGLPPIYGREPVLESLRGALANSNAPRIKINNARAMVMGPSAMVICEEHIGGAVLIATNVFVFEDEAWRLVHHHAGMRAGTQRAAEPPPPDKRILH